MDEELRKKCQALNDRAIYLTGLCEVLCTQSGETIAMGELGAAMELSWAYKALADMADRLADDLSEIAP